MLKLHPNSRHDMAHYQLIVGEMSLEHKWCVTPLNEHRPGYASRECTTASRLTAQLHRAGNLSGRVLKGHVVGLGRCRVGISLLEGPRHRDTRRAGDFARIYARLTERVIPASAGFVLRFPCVPASSCSSWRPGITESSGTFTDLTDYHRQSCAPKRVEFAENFVEGVLKSRRVEQVDQTRVHSRGRAPASLNPGEYCLLSPFDPVLVWNRDRANRLQFTTVGSTRLAAQKDLRLLRVADPVGRQRCRAARYESRPTAWRCWCRLTSPKTGCSRRAVGPRISLPELRMPWPNWLELGGGSRSCNEGDLASTLSLDTVGRYAFVDVRTPV